MKELLCVFIGGGLGSSIRYFLSLFALKFFGAKYYATFLANILGCFLIGFVFGLIMSKNVNMPNNLKLFIVVGFLGGLSTFSSFANESYLFLKNGEMFTFITYSLTTFIFTFIAVCLGYFIAQHS